MSNRRDFIKKASISSLGLIGLSTLESKATQVDASMELNHPSLDS